MSAADRVLHTYELLERILLELDDPIGKFTLLAAQRVSTLFRDIIANSKPLQRALFFAPPGKFRFESNAALEAKVNGMLETSKHFLLLVRCPRPQRMDGEWVNASYIRVRLKRGDFDGQVQVHRPEASWRKMYLSSAPYSVHELANSGAYQWVPQLLEEGDRVRDPTMGEIIEITKALRLY